MATKLSVNLPDEAVEALRELSAREGITMTEALRRAISVQRFLQEQEAEGGKVLVEDKDKSIRQLVFR